MRGQRFLVLAEGPNDAVVVRSQGFVKKDITSERYLCTFTPAGQPATSRIVTLDEMLTWTFFNNDKEMMAFVTSFDNQKPPAPTAKTPSEDTSTPPEGTSLEAEDDPLLDEGEEDPLDDTPPDGEE
jgi:hypothetical protein